MFILANTSSHKFIPYELGTNNSYTAVKNKPRFKNTNHSSNFMNMSLGHKINYNKNKEEEDVKKFVTSLQDKSVTITSHNTNADTSSATDDNITTISYKNEVEEIIKNNNTKNMLEELGEKVSVAIKQDLTNTQINKSLENNIEDILGLLSQNHSTLFALLKIYSPADSLMKFKK